MALVVQKYGGTSVGSVELITNVARRVVAAKLRGDDLVVVVSAMAGETNRLVALAQQICDMPDEREGDVVLASREQGPTALMLPGIRSQGHKARSFLAHQMRIRTDNAYGKARIKSIDASRV